MEKNPEDPYSSGLCKRGIRGVASVLGAGLSSINLGRVVMDRLKHSREILETPTCPSCGFEMQWCRSELVKFAPVTNWHLFNCPSCLLIAEAETVCEPVWVSPDNFAASRFRFFS